MTAPSISPHPVSAVLVLLLSLGAARVHAAGEQAEAVYAGVPPDPHELGQKHTPKIVAPNRQAREWFTVTVSVGAGDSTPRCPSTSFAYIALYKDTWRSRASISIRYSQPTVTLTIALDEAVAAGGGEAYPLAAWRPRKDRSSSVGARQASSRPLRGAFISTVTRAAGWSPTVTLAGTVPRRSCQTCSLLLARRQVVEGDCPSHR